MTRHIGAETLARFRGGDLSRRRSLRIRAHLAGCTRCSDLNEDLAGVTTLLADVQPPPIPEHLSARIQTALAAEAAKRATLTATSPAATSVGSTGDEATAPGTPAPRRGGRSPRHQRPVRGQPRWSRLSSPFALRTMAAAAAAVVVVGGFYEVVTHVGGSAAPSSSTSAGSAAPRSSSVPQFNSPGAIQAAGPQLRYVYAGHQDSVSAVQSGTNYAPATLGSQVSQALKQNPPGPPGLAEGRIRTARPADRTAFGGIPVIMLQGCVTRLAAGQQVLLVDLAMYQGKPATVIVTRASKFAPEQVWVVGTGCSDTSSDLFTHATLAAAG